MTRGQGEELGCRHVGPERPPEALQPHHHSPPPWGPLRVHLQGTMDEDGKTALTPRRPVADTTVYKFKLALPFH